MNYGISVLFRAIPLAMALLCFGYGTFIYVLGDDPNRLVAGPVVFSLGMICIALFAPAATIIRQIIHTYGRNSQYALPVIAYLAAVITIIGGIVHGFFITLLPALLVGIFDSLGFVNATATDVDTIVAALLYAWIIIPLMGAGQ